MTKKISIESVLEEIKRNLGEAKVKSIAEEDDEQPTRLGDPDIRRREAELERQQRNADNTDGPTRLGDPDPHSGPGAVRSPSTRTQTTTPDIRNNGRVIDPGTGEEKGKVDTGTGETIPSDAAKQAAAAAKPPTPTPAPAASAPRPSTSAPRPTPSAAARPAPAAAATKPPSNFSTNNNSPYGFARPGSDEDTAANFFASSDRMMAAQKAQQATPTSVKTTTPRPARPGGTAPRPIARGTNSGSGGNVTPLAENFDQFVKKFIKENR